MPFKSQAQWRWMHAAEARGEVPQGTAARWAQETQTPYKALPAYAGFGALDAEGRLCIGLPEMAALGALGGVLTEAAYVLAQGGSLRQISYFPSMIFGSAVVLIGGSLLKLVSKPPQY